MSLDASTFILNFQVTHTKGLNSNLQKSPRKNLNLIPESVRDKCLTKLDFTTQNLFKNNDHQTQVSY